ncbi:hypothetical protein [Beijerinckia indica]|uniref:hypothetical protein n=1 Tax=Beijerinckia indica TaxID=533 RepID=UPI0011D09361|nr:hypothetical protein [Beijerinckia indica]
MAEFKNPFEMKRMVLIIDDFIMKFFDEARFQRIYIVASIDETINDGFAVMEVAPIKEFIKGECKNAQCDEIDRLKRIH